MGDRAVYNHQIRGNFEGQLQNNQLHSSSSGQASRYRRGAPEICAVPSKFPLTLKTWQIRLTEYAS